MSKIDDAILIIERLGVPNPVATDLVSYMKKIEDEIRTMNLGKSSAGKFVETVVQALQALDSPSKKYDQSIKDVDKQLLRFESQNILALNNDSRLGIVRVARSIQCMRSKRSLVHKNQIDPNAIDLEFVFHSAQWILTEFIRLGGNSSIEDAAGIVAEIQKPVIPIIEVAAGRPLVLDTKIATVDEALIVLYHGHSRDNKMTRSEIGNGMSRRSSSSVSKAISSLWKRRLIDGDQIDGYKLTSIGIAEAHRVIEEAVKRSQNRD